MCYTVLFQPLINDYAEVFPEDYSKQENCALPVTGAIAKLNTSSKLITMTTMLLASDYHTSSYVFDLVPHNFHEEWLFIDSIGGDGFCCQ